MSDILTTRARKRLRLPATMRNPLAIVGAVIIVAWLFIALAAPLVAPYDPLAQDFEKFLAPSGAHWFGTDELGRDVFSRLVYGSRISIIIPVLLVVLSMLLGSTLGAIAGYFGKVADEIIMRIADLVFAFPVIILAMVIAASRGNSLINAVFAMLIVTWPSYARVTRSLVVVARGSEYVIAGRLLGASSFSSLTRDIAPNVAAPVVVLATLDVGTAVLLLTGLSFLGLGSVAPAPEWGAMISAGAAQFTSWWVAVFPGLAILSIVLAFNFLGDALRDQLDPRTAGAVKGRAL